ncbi:MAG: DUF2442 domain-containing protein [Acidobacteria bacterium]|nr:DUF2442 domain-containing protein [Acidobacteriota bacterium]
MKKVVSVKTSEDFTLILEFSDGKIRKFGVKPYLEIGVFQELKNLDYFKDIRIAFGTVQWKNEQDFSPETLYLESFPIKENEFGGNFEKVL